MTGTSDDDDANNGDDHYDRLDDGVLWPVTSRHITSYDIISRHVPSHHVLPRHTTPCHVIYRHITSYHVAVGVAAAVVAAAESADFQVYGVANSRDKGHAQLDVIDDGACPSNVRALKHLVTDPPRFTP